jgi:uncharacterized protein
VLRAVFDTNIVVSALLWTGAPRLLFDTAGTGRLSLITSLPLLDELEDVLAREKLDVAVAKVGVARPALIQSYASLAYLVEPAPVVGIAPDRDDDIVIGTAIAGGAEIIVTGDKPLLGVGTYRGVRLVSAASAIELLSA